VQVIFAWHFGTLLLEFNQTAKSSLLQYRQAVKSPPFALQQKQRSFLTFGFGAGPARRESHVNVNVTPTSHDLASDTPEIRKYKKRFNSEILCAALWGAYTVRAESSFITH